MHKKKIAEGKTKIIFQGREKNTVLIFSKDRITAGDGARVNLLKGKGRYSNQTAGNCFKLLDKCGIKSHFISSVDQNTFKAYACRMIPLEVVCRRIAYGSYVKRNPHIKAGHVFKDILAEFFLKDDARHDPLVGKEDILYKEKLKAAGRRITSSDLDFIENTARDIFEILERAWAVLGVTLVDLKVEFGINSKGRIILADVIDNDSWRIWPGGSPEEMRDKQVYRNLKEVTPLELKKIQENYQWVSEETENFLKNIPLKAVIFMGSKCDQDVVRKITNSLDYYSVDFDVNIISAHKNTEKLLSVLEYYNKHFPCIVFIAVAGRSNALGPVIDGNTLHPVINCPPVSDFMRGMDLVSSLRMPSEIAPLTIIEPENAALAAVKILAENDVSLWARLNFHRKKIKGASMEMIK